MTKTPAPDLENAVVYVATKRMYVDEAIASVKSLRATGTPCKVYLKAPQSILADTDADFFDEIIFIESFVESYIDKAGFLESIAEKNVLFLDGDTHVVSNLGSAFGLLKRFELAAAHAPVRLGGTVEADVALHLDETEIPAALCEFNTGVIFARNSERMRRILRKWPQYQRDGDRHDQPSFTRLIWDNDVSFYTLPPEYNARVIFPVFLCGPAHILHARLPDAKQSERIINASHAPRTIRPGQHMRLPSNTAQKTPIA